MIYINIKYNGHIETIDEASTMKEARQMVREYNYLNDGVKYYISNKCTNEWRN